RTTWHKVILLPLPKRETELAQSPVQGRATDTEGSSNCYGVPLLGLARPEQASPLFGEPSNHRLRHRPQLNRFRDSARRNVAVRPELPGPLDRETQLAHVPRPRIVEEHPHSVGVEVL